jgi:hypothetical protein
MLKHGYYKVKNEIFYKKIDALIYASKTKSEVKWQWFDCYDKIDWEKESVYSLQEIYKIRALQLREKYDYLILSFSGGSDSWQICKTFLDNNIKLDEIFIRWPWQGSKNLHKPSLGDISMSNQLSEWEFTTKPMIEHLQKNYPDIKITLHDWSVNLEKYIWNEEMWQNAADSNLGPGAFFAHNSIGSNEKLLLNKGKKVGFVVGIDKPQLCVIKDRLYCYFSDGLINNHGWDISQRNIEAFYWTNELPDIVHVQVREIYRYLQNNIKASELINWLKKEKSERIKNENIWFSLIKTIIYPGYGNWFQSEKEENLINSKIYGWLFKNADGSDFLKGWQGSLDNLINSIDKKYFYTDTHGNLAGIKTFTSKFYFIGNLNNDI